MYNQDMPKGRPSDSPRPPFGQRLHDLRESAGLTQSQVAEQLGISPRAYAFWERKPVALKANHIIALAEVFNVSTDSLLGHSPKSGTAKRNGPKSRIESMLEEVADLPRPKQKRIVSVIEALLAQEAVAS